MLLYHWYSIDIGIIYLYMSVIPLYFSGYISILGMLDEDNKSNNNHACNIYTVSFILKSVDQILKTEVLSIC